MNWRIWVSAALLAASGVSWAQRPLVYPLRSQSAGAQSVDNAYCYWQAKEQTHVDMAREPQQPWRAEPIAFAPDAGRGASAPPLPATPEQAKAASAPPAAGASTPAAGSSTIAAMPGAATAAAASNTGGAAAAGAASLAGASGVGLPPLPPPEPPMTRYWRAYGECMQSRGYGVR